MKFRLTGVLLLLGVAFNTVSAQTDSVETDSVVVPLNTDSIATHTQIGRINSLISLAEKQLGNPYVYGGKRPGGFDCSGFVSYCYKTSLGITLSPSATYYYNHGRSVTKQNARPGDVICFTGSRAGTTVIGHVGIIYEVTPTEIYFIHSALNGGVRRDSLSQAYYSLRFLSIRRIIE